MELNDNGYPGERKKLIVGHSIITMKSFLRTLFEKCVLPYDSK